MIVSNSEKCAEMGLLRRAPATGSVPEPDAKAAPASPNRSGPRYWLTRRQAGSRRD